METQSNAHPKGTEPDPNQGPRTGRLEGQPRRRIGTEWPAARLI